MTVYRPGLPPDVEHRWLWWRRRCTCGWTQRQGPNPFRSTGSGWGLGPLTADPPVNYPYHLEDMAEWEQRSGGRRGPFPLRKDPTMRTVRVIIEVDGRPVDFPMVASVDGSTVDTVLAAMLGEAQRQVEAGLIDLDREA